jgi:hypothetical protein
VAINEITGFKGIRYDEEVVNAVIHLFEGGAFKMSEP